VKWVVYLVSQAQDHAVQGDKTDKAKNYAAP
jgi:hypothetical protein